MTTVTPTNITNPGSIPPYVYGYQPYTNITPFTYRDGATFLEIFEGAISYLNGTVIPFINNNFSEFDDEFTADMNTLIAEVNAQIAALTKYVDDSVASIINNSITVQDPVMKGIVSDPASQTTGALKNLYVPYAANAADGSITYAALQSALTAAASSGRKVIAYGTITTDQTITIKCDADLGRLNVNYTGNGIAVQVGANSAVLTYNKDVITPHVIHTSKTILGWSQVAGTIGVRLINLIGCRVFVTFVRNFETSFDNRGEGAGHVYNTIILGTINNGKFGISTSCDAVGWSNQNTYIGGSVQMDSAEGNRVVGTRALMLNTAPNLPNTNTFLGVSFEGNGWEYQFETFGLYNTMYNCRFEASLGARCWFRNGSVKNVVRDGYGTLTPTYEGASAGANIIDMPNGHRRVVSGLTNMILENGSSGANAALTILDPGATANSVDPTTAYDWMLAGLALHGKRAADLFDRIAISASAGNVLMGNGSAAPVAGIAGNAGYLQIVSGTIALYPLPTGVVDLGISGQKFNNGWFAGPIHLGTTTTAGRPTAASVGAGGMLFDTDLGKPIFAVGSVWKDAMGTTV